MMWRPIAQLRKLEPDSFIIAKNLEGFIMVFRVQILLSMMKPGTPKHLQFHATHFIPQEELLTLQNMEEVQ